MDILKFEAKPKERLNLEALMADNSWGGHATEKIFGRPVQRRGANDSKSYRRGYPGQVDDLTMNENFLFYSGKIRSRPDGDFVDNIHSQWWGDAAKLEIHHGYIQWLFPIRERGMNHESQPLQLHELQKIKEDPECLKRFIRSYELMLHFYGTVLANPETGQLTRGDNWEQQYHNLRTHSHNFLRITRILKCLGEMGFEHYKKPFLDHFVTEIWETQKLSDCASSCRDYWVGTLKNSEERKSIKKRISRMTQHEFAQSTSEEVVPSVNAEAESEVITVKEAKVQFGAVNLEEGEAIVQVPPSAFSKDYTCFTYLLTPIGRGANIYVKKPFKDSCFTIGCHDQVTEPLRIHWELTGTCSGDFGLDDMFTTTIEEAQLDCEADPEPKKVIFGSVSLDDTEVEVEIPPSSFEKAYTKYVYHLTPIGSFAELFVASKLQNRTFTIGCKQAPPEPLIVHWEISGVSTFI